jgi:hypothetical protein
MGAQGRFHGTDLLPRGAWSGVGMSCSLPRLSTQHWIDHDFPSSGSLEYTSPLLAILAL